MQKFRAHYVAFQGSLCGKLCNFFQFILSYMYYTWSKEKKVNIFSTQLERYLVHQLRTKLDF